ncbi:MAG: hypothetical protein GC154_04640 [bacterium]|nr:hypothetical protein [bacterium]
MDQKFFTNTTVDSSVYIYSGIAFILFLVIIIVAYYYFQRFKKIQELKEEMEQLDLGDEGEGAVIDMVKRYAMQEPVEILLSIRKFDEMAIQEIERVLSSAGSSKAKQQFIDLIYEIRMKTYFPNLSNSETEATQIEPKSTPKVSMNQKPITAASRA